MILPSYTKRLPTNWSVSQVELFLDCNRKWAFKSLWKIPEPPNEAAARGGFIHKAAENTGAQLADGADLETALNAHSPTDAPWMSYVRALAAQGLLPKPGESSAREHRFTLPTHTEIPFIGVIDLILDERSPIEITDWKSTSDIRYAKTPLELLTNLQLNVYAHYVFQNDDSIDTVRARLAYVEAKKIPLKTKLPRVVDVHVDLDRETVRRIWQGELPFGEQTKDYRLPLILDKMLETAAFADEPDDIPPTTTTCTKYGGCPYRTSCGLSPLAGAATARNSQHEPLKRVSIQETKTMGMLSGNKNGTNSNGPTKVAPPATQAAAPVATKPPAGTGFIARANAAKPPGEAARQAKLDEDFGPAKVPTGVVPPDAPSRMTAQEPAQEASGAAEPAEAPKKPGRPRKAAVEAQEGGESVPAPAARPAKAKQGMTLYVDCYPVKGLDVEPTSAEDWIGAALIELNEWAVKEKGVPDYRLTSFSEEKANFAAAVQDLISKNRPSAMIISTSGIGRDLLGLLIPHAQVVVRALRG